MLKRTLVKGFVDKRTVDKRTFEADEAAREGSEAASLEVSEKDFKVAGRTRRL